MRTGSSGVGMASRSCGSVAWAGETLERVSMIEPDAPLEQIPVYVRDGAALQWAG